MLKLYELPAAFANIEAELLEAEGELTPELEAKLDQLELNLEVKTEGICTLIRSDEAEAAALQPEIDRLKAWQSSKLNKAKGLKTYLQRELERLGRDKVQTQRYRVRLQKNGTPSINWTGDLDDLPEAFRKPQHVELDGSAAIAAYRAGNLPEGFQATVGQHLRIS